MSSIIHKFQFLEFLPNELQSLRSYYELFDLLQQKPSQKLGDHIWKIWDELEKCTPKLKVNPLRNFQSLNQKITVTQWVENNSSFADMVDLLRTRFKLTDNFQTIQVWSDSDDLYWLSLYLYLEAWSRLTGATLESVEWTTHSKAVWINLKWKDKFRVVEKLDFKITKYPFWNVSFREQPLTCVYGASTALLLSAQLLAQRGGSFLNSIDSSPNQLIMELRIPRVDPLSPKPPAPLISENNMGQVGDYILNQVFSKHYINRIEQLEQATLYEIKQLKSGAFNDNSLSELQNALDKLIKIKESLEKIK
jgi:hypothetical protein